MFTPQTQHNSGCWCVQLTLKGSNDDRMIRLHAAMLSVPEQPDRRGVCCGADSGCSCEADGVDCVNACGCWGDLSICANPLGASRYQEDEVRQHRQAVLAKVASRV
jgi:hypothetical protein